MADPMDDQSSALEPLLALLTLEVGQQLKQSRRLFTAEGEETSRQIATAADGHAVDNVPQDSRDEGDPMAETNADSQSTSIARHNEPLQLSKKETLSEEQCEWLISIADKVESKKIKDLDLTELVSQFNGEIAVDGPRSDMEIERVYGRMFLKLEAWRRQRRGTAISVTTSEDRASREGQDSGVTNGSPATPTEIDGPDIDAMAGEAFAEDLPKDFVNPPLTLKAPEAKESEASSDSELEMEELHNQSSLGRGDADEGTGEDDMEIEGEGDPFRSDPALPALQGEGFSGSGTEDPVDDEEPVQPDARTCYLSKAQARLFAEVSLTCRQGAPTILSLSRGDFQNLANTLRHWTNAHAVAFNFTKKRTLGTFHILSFKAAFALSINDLSSAPGSRADAMVCHAWGTNGGGVQRVFLANRVWDEGQAREFRGLHPMARVRLANTAASYLWWMNETLVLDLRLVLPYKPDHSTKQVFKFHLPEIEDFPKAPASGLDLATKAGQLYLFVSYEGVLLASTRELLLRVHSDDVDDESFQLHQKKSKKPGLWVTMSLDTSTKCHKRWSRDRYYEMNQRLGARLTERLVDLHRSLRRGESQDIGLRLRSWVDIREEVMPGY